MTSILTCGNITFGKVSVHMKIKVNYNCKYYPHAPKATQRSKNLGLATSWLYLLIYAFFLWMLFYVFLVFATDSIELGAALALLPTALCIGGIFLLKKKLMKKIDEAAAKETEENLKNQKPTSNEFADMFGQHFGNKRSNINTHNRR